MGRRWLVLGNRSIVSFRTLIDDAGIEHQDLVLLRLVTCSYVYPYMPTGVEINYCCTVRVVVHVYVKVRYCKF